MNPIKISKGKTALPPRLFIYGVAGIGKTTLGASIPGAVVMPIEEGADAIDCAKMDRPADIEGVINAINALCDDAQGFSTLVIDSVTAMEQLIWQAICKENKWGSIESPGFGRGYVASSELWRHILDRLTSLRKAQGMSIVLVGHVEIKTVNAPDSEPFDRYQPRLHKIPCAMLTEWSDALLFAHHEKNVITDEKTGKTRAVGSGARVIKTTERPSHLAKNRYGMPDEIPMSYECIIASINKAFA